MSDCKERLARRSIIREIAIDLRGKSVIILLVTQGHAKMKKSLLHYALNVAVTNIPRHPEYHHYLHYTFIVQGNKILEWGTNNSLEPKKHFGYHERIQHSAPKSHSELTAYKKARGLLGTKPFELINIRLTRSGLVRLSKPCVCCHQILRELGCTKFYYSYESGFLTTR